MTYIKQNNIQDKANNIIQKELEDVKVKINSSKTTEEDLQEQILSANESIENIENKILIAKKYEATFSNTFDWDLGTVWSKNHGLGGFPDIVNVWAKFPGDYWMKIANQMTEVDPTTSSANESYHVCVNISVDKIRIESSKNYSDSYFYVGGNLRNPTEITDYRIVAIKF